MVLQVHVLMVAQLIRILMVKIVFHVIKIVKVAKNLLEQL